MRKVLSMPYWRISLILALAFGFTASAWAAGPGCGQRHVTDEGAPAAERPGCAMMSAEKVGCAHAQVAGGRPGLEPMNRAVPRPCMAIGRELGFDSQQQQQFDQIREKARQQMPTMRQDVMRMRAELRALTLAERPDLDAIHDLVVKIGDVRVKMENLRIETRLAIRDLLTVEQRERLLAAGPREEFCEEFDCGPVCDCCGCVKGEPCECGPGCPCCGRGPGGGPGACGSPHGKQATFQLQLGACRGHECRQAGARVCGPDCRGRDCGADKKDCASGRDCRRGGCGMGASMVHREAGGPGRMEGGQRAPCMGSCKGSSKGSCKGDPSSCANPACPHKGARPRGRGYVGTF